MSDRLAHSDEVAEKEIKVTPEMFEVGVKELSLFDYDDKGYWVVEAIYTAMERIRRLKEGGTE